MQRCFFSLLLSVVNARRKKKKRKMERNTARSMIASSSHQLRRKSVSRFVRLLWLYYFKIVRKFPLKIHTKDTTQTTNKQKKECNRKPAHSSTLPHSLTYAESKSSLLKRERMTEAGIEPAISGLFLTKIALNPKGGCFKIHYTAFFLYCENC